jgi:hypothetical protein
VHDDRLRSARLTGTAALALLLFNFPFLGVFDSDALLGGMPVIWLYLFVVWGATIALVAWVVRS